MNGEAGPKAGLTAALPTIPDDAVIVNIVDLRRWAEQVAYAIDNPDTAIDALLELAESLEQAAGCAR